jgi:hypothetical protein
VALGIARQQAPGGRQRHMPANAGEDVQNFALLRQGVADGIGGQQRQ